MDIDECKVLNGGCGSGVCVNNAAGAPTCSCSVVKGPAVVLLGTAGDFTVLAKAAVSTVPASSVTGNLGVSPAAATYITGFSLLADATNAFSTSVQVIGKVYAADYAAPTPAKLTTFSAPQHARWGQLASW